MQRARLFVCLIVGFFLIVVTSSSVSPSSTGITSENGAAGVEPVIRLEKPRYVEGEAIRFWVGVAPKNSSVIPEELRKPCSLSITKPDGARRVESVGWPVDGMLNHGWSGGWGFGEEKVEPGRYSLILECAGEKTPPVELIVERSEILDQIKNISERARFPIRPVLPVGKAEPFKCYAGHVHLGCSFRGPLCGSPNWRA